MYGAELSISLLIFITFCVQIQIEFINGLAYNGIIQTGQQHTQKNNNNRQTDNNVLVYLNAKRVNREHS